VNAKGGRQGEGIEVEMVKRSHLITRSATEKKGELRRAARRRGMNALGHSTFVVTSFKQSAREG